MSAKKPQRNGRLASTRGGPSLKKPRLPSKELETLLGRVYDQFRRLNDRAANAQARNDFVFHMSDWFDDLDRLQAIYKHPERISPKKSGHEIAGFLYHVIPHLNAAGRLLLEEIPDAFSSRGPER